MPNDDRPNETEFDYPETLRITVMSGRDALDSAVSAAGAAERGERPPATVSFESVSGLRQLLTDRRVELLETLMHDPAGSITQLADRLGRSYSVVHDDIGVLEEYGIVKFDEEANGRARGVFVPYETVEVAVTIHGKTDRDRMVA